MALAAYELWLRPWFLKWGATEAEVKGQLPGDELVVTPKATLTRAITIQASAAEVWPWLVQMGQGRGGLYSYDWLENIFGCDIHSADRIVPEFQNLRVGDDFWLHPKLPPLKVAIIEPEHALVLGAGGDRQSSFAAGYPWVSWSFVLSQQSERATRLIIRWRTDYQPGFSSALANQYLLEPIHFVMERKMMLGIRQRAEATKSRDQRFGLGD